jgi:Zn-dependent protease
MSDFNPQKLVLVIPFLLFGLTAHEFAHAWMANRLGDDTAARAGRLSFNPFRHLDPFGALILILTNFIGWAKPVPVDPRNFREPVRDMSLVALAGPVTNFALATILALGFRFNIIDRFLGLLPLNIADPLGRMCFYGFLINLGLSIFNLVPIPPLDGFRVLAYFLPPKLSWRIQSYHFISFILLMVLLATGILGRIIGPIFLFFASFLLGE